jgi:hypothetical protein
LVGYHGNPRAASARYDAPPLRGVWWLGKRWLPDAR